MGVQVRDKVYSMRNSLDPYGIHLGFAIDAVSALRGTVSAAASGADNYSDQGITIAGVCALPHSCCPVCHPAYLPNSAVVTMPTRCWRLPAGQVAVSWACHKACLC